MINQNETAAKFMTGLKFKRWAIIHDTTDYGKGHNKYFSQYLTQNGGEIAGTFGVVLGPAGMAAEQIARLNQALTSTLQEPSFRSQLESQGLRLLGGTPEQCRSFVRDDLARWKQVAATTNLPTE